MEQIIIHGTASELQGVGRLSDGRAVFVPGALPGEKVNIEITKSADRFCESRLVEIIEASPRRVEPDCPHAGICGGCQARHMDYAFALEQKRQKVYDALKRIGGVEDPTVFDTLGCEDPDHTRNKAEYPIANVDGKMVIGAYAGNSHRVIPLSDCLLQNRESLKALKWFSENLNRLPGAKHLKFLVTRVSRENEMMVTLSGDAPILSEVEKIGKLLTQAVPSVKSVFFCQLNRRFAHALDGKCTRIDGLATLTDTLLGLKFELAPQAFFQINPIQTEKLYTKALEAAGLIQGRKGCILDAYCGAGTITLAAARHADHAVGIEIVAPAIENAKRNAKANGLSENTRFICADAAKEIPRLISAGERFDAAILDPPRKGADEALLTSLIKSKVPVISYVSCNPATLARDVKILCAGGYHLEWAQPVDMFPGTSHVESVVCLSRENKSPFEKLEKTSTPLLYRAAQNSVYGQRYEFETGSITDAMFVYLDGSSSPKSIEALDRNYRLRPLVCLTGAWEQFIKQTYPNAHVCNRYMMKPACRFLTDGEIALPDGFRVALFDEKAFSLHPFSHGENYSSFAAFQEYGAGAVVWHNDRIVASASSFITINGEIELDVSTEEAYRGKGLASACISLMLQDCEKRRIVVHWDAQNEASLHLAEKFGFERAYTYSVYFLPKRITDESIVCLTND